MARRGVACFASNAHIVLVLEIRHAPKRMSAADSSHDFSSWILNPLCEERVNASASCVLERQTTNEQVNVDDALSMLHFVVVR